MPKIRIATGVANTQSGISVTTWLGQKQNLFNVFDQ